MKVVLYLSVLKITEVKQIVKGISKKRHNIKKGERHWDRWNANGHVRDTYFKLHGYPKWYKDIKNQKAKSSVKNLSNLASTSIDADGDKASMDVNYINCAHMKNFASTILSFALNAIEFLPTSAWY